jgi:predicted AAA+ superfamily ATPase
VTLHGYQARVADEELARRLQSSGAVLIEGAKACGKTETARQMAASEVLLDVDRDARSAAEIDPSLVLSGDTPRLIDEWQVEPGIWDHVRRAVDDRAEPGQFILAGSAAPADDATRHSGAGRISRLRMRPMSLFESGLSDGSISLGDLLAGGAAAAGDRGVELPDLAEALARGGWPALQRLPVNAAIEGVADYLEEICRTDVNRVDGVRRDPDRVRRLLQSLARNVSTHVAMSTLAADAATGGSDPLKPETVGEYLAALRRLFVVEEQLPWEPHLRSRSILRKSAKRHFVDPSLAAAALGAGPPALLRDLNLFGLLFESLVVRDLRVYVQPGRGEVRQFLDNKGLEIDAIVERDGNWGAFEIKLGGEKPIEQAAAGLLKFAAEIDTRRSGAPAVLGVIVPTGYGYVREDGVQVVPLTALRP